MASLYCESDGDEKVQEAIADKGKFAGEYTKIVFGTLITDGLRCDKCNRPLDSGDKAYYVAYLSEKLRDPKGESDYFEMSETKTIKY